MSATTDAPRSGDQRIDGQLAGVRWVGPISYGDPQDPGAYGYYVDGDDDGLSAQDEGFARLTAAQLAAVHAVLSADLHTRAARAGFSVEGLTDLEVAERLGVSRFTVRSWRLKGVGPRFLKMGRAVRYRSQDVDEYERQALVETQAPSDHSPM